MIKYSLQEVYGIDEKPPEKCPTYLDRSVHTQFQYAVNEEKQHIVVYGASRQGKSWMVEKYCPQFIRVGCDVKHTRDKLFKSILSELNIEVGTISDTSKNDTCGNLEGSIEGSAGIPLLSSATLTGTTSLNVSTTKEHLITYVNIDLSNQSEVIKEISKHLNHRFIVIENFHYLNIDVQKSFASSLREFLYHNIRVIIVGVWKETTKLVSYASDLSDRCTYCDIGNWSTPELENIISLGDNALNVITSPAITSLFIQSCGLNIGIFKTFLRNFLKEYCVFYTVTTTESPKILDNLTLAEDALQKSAQEIISPVLDRVTNLATSRKTGAKGMRYYIVKAILTIIAQSSTEKVLSGIEFQDILTEVNTESNCAFESYNIKQELAQLHLRAETGKSDRDMNTNLIPLFYFDTSRKNGVLYIVESALIFAKQRGTDFVNFLGPIDNYLK